MKPLKLSIEGFGPYVNKQIIDFTILGNRTLFLIHGNTGSGKSTILDAICFALYGETSGNERTGTQMRSNFADSSVPTEVTFEFSVGGDSYRITRNPAYAKKLVGAALWKITDYNSPELIANKKTLADEKITELLGFNVETFRQVVVLPQGKFRELLMSPVKDRQKILEVLFKTEEYRVIEEALKEAAKDMKSKVEHAVIKKREILTESDCSSFDDLCFKYYEYARCIAKYEEIVKESQDKSESARNLLEKVRRDNEKIEEQKNAENSLKALQIREDEFKQKQAKLINARKALPLSEVEQSLSERIKEFEEAVKEHEKTETELAEADSFKKAAEELLNSELAGEGERLKAQETLSLLTSFKEKVREIEVTKKNITLYETTRKKLFEKIVNSKLQYENLKNEMTHNQNELVSLAAIASQKELLQRELVSFQQKHQQSIQLNKLKKEFFIAQSELAKKQEHYDNLQFTLKQAKEKLDTLNALWIEGQAAFLAQSLIDGKPCPVCGATEHPAPAAKTEEIPTENDLKAQKETVEQFELQRNFILKEKSDIESALAVLSSNIESLEGALADGKDTAVAVAEAQGKLRAAMDADIRLETIRKTLDAIEKQAAELQKEIESSDTELKAIIEYESKARSKAEVIEKDVNEEFRTEDALLKAVEQAQVRVLELKKSLEKARAEESAASANFAAKTESLKNIKEHLQLSSELKEKLQLQFQSKIEEAGFNDTVEFQNSKLIASDIETLEREISEFFTFLQAAKNRLERAQDAAMDLSLKDIGTFENAYESARSKYEEQLKVSLDLENTHSNIGNYLSKLEKTEKEISSHEKTYSNVGYISDVANGKNAYNITFQRFVLASVLDDCLLVASKRLQMMSRGRYTLERAVSAKTGRAAGGLDLEVYDSYSGLSRQVSTLSGGESFLASLSMALGLSDVVQSYCGGIHLETIFVDEGFGNLDPESLDLALKALVDLQAAGKLVGIISHVPELKERIDARLEVTFNGKGSTTRFIV
ncbi:AAA family ATPase [Candidatus Magnetomonas plexicatena]|uniref:AAA family ATPase n=1 Tax=Candidatus Magnetomonas plexicatena TaxID=2552947 RepID=UPI001C7958EC|nr:SMC family ATPase [Nitrospirales bacterium LBB_01]